MIQIISFAIGRNFCRLQKVAYAVYKFLVKFCFIHAFTWQLINSFVWKNKLFWIFNIALYEILWSITTELLFLFAFPLERLNYLFKIEEQDYSYETVYNKNISIQHRNLLSQFEIDYHCKDEYNKRCLRIRTDVLHLIFIY